MLTMTTTHGDKADQSQAVEQFDLQVAMINRESSPHAHLRPNGTCHYCYTPGIEGVFCDGECADEYELYERNRIGR